MSRRPDRQPDPPGSRPVDRVRAVIAAAALVAFAFSQQPGLLVGDTKADLVLDPGGFLRRALSAWDPQQAFGQLSNQSYGYLWPMGPFFWLGDALGLPGWVAQRGWWALVLVVGCTGALRLAGALGIGTPTSRLVAAVAYAVSPRVLSVLGAVSVEAWPAAVLPWVLLPLVRGAAGDLSPRRAAALSGLAVFCLGGVNAAATLAVLPLPALYLLTRGASGRRLAAWWAPAVLLATAWWVLPLLVLGRYGYPFLDLIEDAGVTTQVGTVTNTLRGASHWLGYLVVHGAPRLPAGFELAVDPLPVAATAALAAVGLAGLLLPGLRERRWLLGGLLLGTVLVAVGHTGTLTGPLAPAVQDLLDGPLAPLRNVHKADPLLRLPLALGVAHLLAVAGRHRPDRPAAGRTGPPVLPTAGVLLLLAATAAPAWSGRIAPGGAYQATPAYWRQVAGWLAARSADGGGRALLVPSSNFADYRWGSPRDEPLQALARSPWAVRDAVPLGAPGATRLLDGLDARLATGQPSEAYAPVLARAGVRWVVVRNDVDVARSGAERPGVVRAALAGSPGLRPVAAFGPAVDRAYGPLDTVLGPASRPRAVEVFEVAGAAPAAVVYQRAGAVAMSGGAEGVLPLADAGLLTDRAVLGTADPPAGAPAVDAVVVTDTLRRRALNPGGDPGRRYSETLPADAALPRPDVGAEAGPSRQSIAVLDGAAAVTASSSGADPYAAAYRGPDRRPAAAVDGDPATAWVSDAGPVGQWVELRLPAPAEPGTAAVTLLDDPAIGPAVTGLRLDTDAGSVEVTVPAGDRPLTVALPRGPTTRLRVTVTAVSGAAAGSVGVRELTLPGIWVTEAVALPTDGTALTGRLPWTVLAARPAGWRGDCLPEDRGWVCLPGLAAAGEEVGALARRFDTAAAAAATVRATVRPLPGPGLDGLLDRGGGYRASGSSTAVAHPAARPGAAYDGDPKTAWLPAGSDPAPQLRLDLASTVTLSALRLEGAAPDYAEAVRVVLSTPAGDRRVLRPAAGRDQSFVPLRTSQVVLTFERSGGNSGTIPAPLRVPDVTLAGAPDRGTGPVDVGCADGPAVGLDGAVRRLSVRVTPAELLTLAPVPAATCGGTVALGAGTHRLGAGRSAALEVASVAVSSSQDAVAPMLPGRAVTVERADPEHRRLGVAAGPQSYLALAEGFNAGWRATAGGRPLVPVRLDGWRQGWLLPAGGDTVVELSFGPGRAHRLGLLAGLLGILALVPLALLPGGRGVRAAAVPLRLPAAAGPVAAAAVGGLLAGVAGALAGAAAALVPARWRPAAAGGALAVAGLVLGLAPTWAGQPAVTQLLAVGAVALAATAACAPPDQPVGEPQGGSLEDQPGQRGDPH